MHRWATQVLQAGLFLLTCVTTTLTGMRAMANFQSGREPLTTLDDVLPLHWMWVHRGSVWSGLPFSITMLSILLAHEFGHYFAARAFRVDTTLPYVLPGPSVTGTLGAVIRLRGVVRSRKALMVIAAMGPICGFVVAVAAGLLGLVWSVPVVREPMWVAQLNEPVVMVLLKGVLWRGIGVMRHGPLLWHPVLLAAWIGLLHTSLNLLPAGQLDGGHILYVLSPRAHKVATQVATFGLILLGIVAWAPWLACGLALLIPAMRQPHVVNRRRGFVYVPPQFDRRAPAGTKYKLLGLVCLLIALLCVLPMPYGGGSGIDIVRQYIHH